MSAIVKRILTQMGDPQIIEKLLSLPRADFNSLLLEVFAKQAGRTTPADVLKAYRANRFSLPSAADPVGFHALESALLAAAQGMNIETILLSPAAPFGSCSAFGCVDQYNVISALRGTETLSDPSNMLAIIMADKLRSRAAGNTSPLHYAATARVVRAQAFAGKDFFAHFGLFCMVSSGKDTGSYSCEKELLEKHLLFYKKMLQKQFGAKLSIVLRKRSGYKDTNGFFAHITKAVQAMFPGTPLSFEVDDEDNAYYQGVNFKMLMDTKDGPIEIGDGGFVDWMVQMLGSKKQRCLISGIGLDRLLLFCE